MKPLRLKNMIAGCLLAAGALPVWGQSGAPTLVIRIDDLGALHSVNEACIQTYRSGIARSVEVMPVAAWYPEAIKMLKENPGSVQNTRRRCFLRIGMKLKLAVQPTAYKEAFGIRAAPQRSLQRKSWNRRKPTEKLTYLRR